MTAGAGTPRPDFRLFFWMALTVGGSAVSVFFSLESGPEQRMLGPGAAASEPLGWAAYAVRLLRVPSLLWVLWLCRGATSRDRLIPVLAPVGLLGFLSDLSGTVSDLAGDRALDWYGAFSIAATLMFAVFTVYVVRQPPTAPD